MLNDFIKIEKIQRYILCSIQVSLSKYYTVQHVLIVINFKEILRNSIFQMNHSQSKFYYSFSLPNGMCFSSCQSTRSMEKVFNQCYFRNFKPLVTLFSKRQKRVFYCITHTLFYLIYYTRKGIFCFVVYMDIRGL